MKAKSAEEVKSIFEVNKNSHRILEFLSMLVGEKILAGETLIIFDNIEECPQALNTLEHLKKKQMI